jgi:hypothetical protein
MKRRLRAAFSKANREDLLRSACLLFFYRRQNVIGTRFKAFLDARGLA